MSKNSTGNMKKSKTELEREKYIAKIQRIDNDLSIVMFITAVIYIIYIFQRSNLTAYLTDSEVSIWPRLFLGAAVQFGLAGLGTAVMIVFRKENPTAYGLNTKKLPIAIVGTLGCFLPLICAKILSGGFTGYHPFSISLTSDVLAAGMPGTAIGIIIIAIVWGCFESFNYVVIAEKINERFPDDNVLVNYGALFCAVLCILFHPVSLNTIWGTFELLATVIAVYGMLVVKEMTGNAWGCILAFCLLWNAF